MLERPVVFSSIATFHHAEFASLDVLERARASQGVTVSLCIPCLNEEDTIGDVVRILRSELVEKVPLVAEIAVIDSGSTDRSREVAEAAGADVYLASDILPDLPPASGKGENIWKAVHQLRGDILCFVDGDVRNMHPRFVYGMLGALLLNPQLRYVKAFYDRPNSASEVGLRPAGGGRVTEALVRPLFSLFYPQLASIVQPLSGEYAARREVLERMPMPTGYGVETAHLIDILEMFGPEAIGQCDLDERAHRHQDTGALGRMSFAILHAFFERAKRSGRVSLASDLPSAYRHFVREDGVCHPADWQLPDIERPPLSGLPEYFQRHGR